jgi:hypothetical protein
MVDGIVHMALLAVQGILTIYEVCEKTNRQDQLSGSGRSKRSLSQLSPISPHPRAVLIASSAITFGNDCERLVNIAFQTSQTFPSMMSTCADIIQYLRKELAIQYPNEYFHIIMGENHGFGFSVDDGQYFAEIEQERYRVLIFATKRDSQTKLDTHDVNSQMVLKWM